MEVEKGIHQVAFEEVQQKGAYQKKWGYFLSEE